MPLFLKEIYPPWRQPCGSKGRGEKGPKAVCCREDYLRGEKKYVAEDERSFIADGVG